MQSRNIDTPLLKYLQLRVLKVFSLVNSFANLIVTKGPIHTFNGHKVNFYITTGQGWCCNYRKNNATTDAKFFCSSFYGRSFNAVSYEIGSYKDSGRMGYQLHRTTCCAPGSASRPSGGTDIEKTDCSEGNYGVNCKIWSTEINHSGLYNIVCTGTNGSINRLNNV